MKGYTYKEERSEHGGYIIKWKEKSIGKRQTATQEYSGNWTRCWFQWDNSGQVLKSCILEFEYRHKFKRVPHSKALYLHTMQISAANNAGPVRRFHLYIYERYIRLCIAVSITRRNELQHHSPPLQSLKMVIFSGWNIVRVLTVRLCVIMYKETDILWVKLIAPVGWWQKLNCTSQFYILLRATNSELLKNVLWIFCVHWIIIASLRDGDKKSLLNAPSAAQFTWKVSWVCTSAKR